MSDDDLRPRPGTTDPAGTPDPADPADPAVRAARLDELVGEWLDWKQAAEALHVTVGRVRTWIREHQLAAAVPRPKAGQQVPAALIMDGEIVKGVSGLITLLHDGRYDDIEILTWLFTEDDTLPGRPIDALRENRGSEVKRRAQAMALS